MGWKTVAVPVSRSDRRRRWFLRAHAACAGLPHRAESAVSAGLAEVPAPGPASDVPRPFAAACGVPDGAVLQVRSLTSGVTIALPLLQPFLLVGRDPACGLCLQDESVAPRHYYLQWLDGRLYGRALTAPFAGEFWDEATQLQVGRFELTVSGIGAPPAGSAFHGDRPADFELVNLSTTPQHVRPIDRRLILVGSSAECDLPLDDPTLAPFQAAFIAGRGQLWLVDLAGDASTTLAGRAVDWAAVGPGDELALGRFQFTVRGRWREMEAERRALAEALGELMQLERTRLDQMQDWLVRLQQGGAEDTAELADWLRQLGALETAAAATPGVTVR